MLLKLREVFKPRTAPKVADGGQPHRPKRVFPEKLEISNRAKWPSISGVASDSGRRYFGDDSASKEFIVRVIKRHGLGATFFSVVRNEVFAADTRKEARRVARLHFPAPHYEIGFVRERRK